MRSPLATLALALVAAVVCALAAWSFQRGNLDEIFGAPHGSAGELLYPGLNPAAVTRIEISSDGITADLIRDAGGWRVEGQWNDRGDARAALSILQFTQGLRIEDAGDIKDVDRAAVGLESGSVRVRLRDAQNEKLADFRLGSRTPWMATVQTDAKSGKVETISTVFVETRERGRRSHLYICAGDISPLFRDGLRFLRDHRPFFFHPAAIQSIQLRTSEGELSLAREAPDRPWRITKPLELRTDFTAMRALLQGLFDLQAVKIEEASSARSFPEATPGKNIRIALTPFQTGPQPAEATTLEIQLPEEVDARTAPATVSNRPGTVFHLPIKPEPDLVSLAALPLSVNALREHTLTNIQVAAIATIAIRPATGPEILLSAEPGRPWKATVKSSPDDPSPPFPANERRLFDLLKAITTSRVVSFETDAAVDLSPWGLHRPVLTLAFLSHDHQLLELDFGIDDNGGVFFMRRGTSTVSRLDDAFLGNISIRPYEWRQARVWSVSKTDLTRIVRLRSGAPAELLEYDWFHESWKATRDNEDATPELIDTRANFLLDRLVGIECDRWLARDDPAALAALAQPPLRITVFENEVDEFGDKTGEIRRNIGFAPAPDHPGFFYGILLGDSHPFLVAEETVLNLAVPLFEE
jgi:hypothetical protein